MSLYPNQCYPFPASHVPSHHYSSESGTASPGGNNSTCDTFGDFTTASPSAPLWASPTSPKANNYRNSPPFFSQGTPTGGIVSVSPSSPVQNLSYSDEESHDTEHKFDSEINTARDCRANIRALAFLDATAGSEASKLNNDIDNARERGATFRALTLLDATAGLEVSQVARDNSEPIPKPMLTTRQAAAMKYEERQKVKAQIKAKLKNDKETYGKPTPTLVAKQGKETLAVSSRKPKTKTAGDVRDPETVAGMKCQMDIEREKRAQKKALNLLDCGGIA